VAFRSRFRRPFAISTTRKRPRYLWVRNFVEQANPANNPYVLDLLADYRTQASLGLNLPEFTIWRLHIKVYIRFTISAFSSNSGFFYAIYNDNFAIPLTFTPRTQQYSERYYMWDFKSVEEQLIEAANTTVPGLMFSYDIKSHRKLQNINETMFQSIESVGNVSGVQEVTTVYSMLLRMMD